MERSEWEATVHDQVGIAFRRYADSEWRYVNYLANVLDHVFLNMLRKHTVELAPCDVEDEEFDATNSTVVIG